MTDMTDTCILIPPPVIGIKSGLNGICHYGAYIVTSVISVTSVTSGQTTGNGGQATNHPAVSLRQKSPYALDLAAGGRAPGLARLMRVSKWARRMAQDKNNSRKIEFWCTTLTRKMGEKWVILNEKYRYQDTSDDLKNVFEGVLIKITKVNLIHYH
jgi:hypothetical protein